MNRIYPWTRVYSEGRPILEQVRDGWQNLLDGEKRNESEYGRYVSHNAGLFLHRLGGYLAISELRLGTDYRVDLVATHDEGSYGLCYELIELQSPHADLFNSRGHPSAGLNEGMQQIRDWKRWIHEHRSEAKLLFPGKKFRLYDEAIFTYTVIIGRRSFTARHSEKRRQLVSETGVDIRSYDHLTERLTNATILDQTALSSAEEDRLSDLQRNQLSCPFACAFSDNDWHQFLKSRPLDSHVFATNAKKILELRRYSSHLLDFISAVKHISPAEVRSAWHWFDSDKSALPENA